MSEYKPREPVSGWAIGGLTFAATMLVLIGIFQVIAGLVAIFNDDFYVLTRTTRSTSTRAGGAGST